MRANEFTEAITGPIMNADIGYKSVYFAKERPVTTINNLVLKKARISANELYYGLFDSASSVPNTLVGILQLEQYDDLLWQVRLVQIEENFKNHGYGTFLYDYAVMNDGLSLLSDTHLSEGGPGGSKGLWEKLYRHGRFTVCGYNLDTNEILPDMRPSDVFNQHENLVCLAMPKKLKESITEMLSRLRLQNPHRAAEWYGPSIVQSEEF